MSLQTPFTVYAAASLRWDARPTLFPSAAITVAATDAFTLHCPPYALPSTIHPLLHASLLSPREIACISGVTCTRVSSINAEALPTPEELYTLLDPSNIFANTCKEGLLHNPSRAVRPISIFYPHQGRVCPPLISNVEFCSAATETSVPTSGLGLCLPLAGSSSTSCPVFEPTLAPNPGSLTEPRYSLPPTDTPWTIHVKRAASSGTSHAYILQRFRAEIEVVRSKSVIRLKLFGSNAKGGIPAPLKSDSLASDADEATNELSSMEGPHFDLQPLDLCLVGSGHLADHRNVYVTSLGTPFSTEAVTKFSN